MSDCPTCGLPPVAEVWFCRCPPPRVVGRPISNHCPECRARKGTRCGRCQMAYIKQKGDLWRVTQRLARREARVQELLNQLRRLPPLRTPEQAFRLGRKG